MEPATQSLLLQLERSDWFCMVGWRVDQEQEISVDCVHSWCEACELCESDEWDNYRIEQANRFRESLLKCSPDAIYKWNQVVSNLRPHVIQLLQVKCIDTLVPDSYVDAVEKSCRWDIIHLLAEAEFSNFIPQGFYSTLGYWYCKGHFPCGWSESNEKLIVY